MTFIAEALAHRLHDHPYNEDILETLVTRAGLLECENHEEDEASIFYRFFDGSELNIFINHEDRMICSWNHLETDQGATL